MKRNSRLIWGLCAIAGFTALIWPMLPMKHGTKRLSTLPSSGPDFVAKKVELSTADRNFLGKAEAVQFIIQLRNSGNLVMTVVDGSDNRHAVHDPTYCLAGGGWMIKKKQTVSLQSGEATWLSMNKKNQELQALWFFDDGRSQFTSPASYLAKTSLRRVTLGRSGPEPVLVMLRALPGEPVDWHRVRKVLLPGMGFE